MIFKKHFSDRLFVALDQDDDRGFVAWVIPGNVAPPADPTVTLKVALETSSYVGNFFFSAKSPAIKDQQAADDFLNSVFAIVRNGTRQFIWAPDPAVLNAGSVFMAQVSSDGSVFQTALETPLTVSLAFQIQAGMRIKLEEDGATLQLDGSSSNLQIKFAGPVHRPCCR